MKIYMDGVDISGSFASGSPPASIADSDATLGIGAIGDGTSPFDGQIDDVKVWNYALTPLQIKNDYNNGSVRFGD